MCNESFYFVCAATYYAYLFTHTLCFILLSMQNTQDLHQTEITEDFLYYFIYVTQNIHSFYLPLVSFFIFSVNFMPLFPRQVAPTPEFGVKTYYLAKFLPIFSRRSEYIMEYIMESGPMLEFFQIT